MWAPWAVLLCKFNDNDVEPKPRAFYDQLFTSAGVGTMNMVDYFRDNSHGVVDISGSQVFGWLTIPHARSEYTGSGPNPDGRKQLVQWAKDAAVAAKIDLGPFFKVCVVMNVSTDLFGGGSGAVCSPDSTVPSLLGQEMGHGFGLRHSRIDGSTADYKDPWDTMSTAAAYEAPDPTYSWIGPGLNAANMDDHGWLDGSRVWNTYGATTQTIQLRPLHRRDLGGWLCARVGPYYLEFRAKDRWDKGIPAPTVLVHRLENSRSYLMRATSGAASMGVGDDFERGSKTFTLADWVRVTVDAIDAGSQTATVTVDYQPADQPPVVGPAELFGGVANDGGGWIFVNGHIYRVPPRSPVLVLLEQLGRLQAAVDIEITADRSVEVERVYRGIAASVSEHLEDPDELHTPPTDPFDGRLDGFETGQS